ncbi:MAG: ACT domain-containing protein [Clostridia bacterium]|nr:ACT domain-containing protein [Clostridia bacterium]
MNNKVIGYLGPQGTYSEVAAEKLCSGAEKIAYPSFYTLFSALVSGEVDGIAVPIENTLNGAVVQNLDLLQETDGVYAHSACALEIDHRLITLRGADKSSIKRVYSHGQALAQCAKYLAVNFPEAKLIETPSTADCLEKIKSAEDAGIAGSHCCRNGFDFSHENISDEVNNYTQFLLVKRGQPHKDAQSDRIFFSVTCRHKVGALVELLTVLKENGINMTEIESRPIKDKTGEFRFFMEVEGNYAEANVKAALEKLKAAARSLKLLGCYISGLPK